jgi:hypothetical protein
MQIFLKPSLLVGRILLFCMQHEHCSTEQGDVVKVKEYGRVRVHAMPAHRFLAYFLILKQKVLRRTNILLSYDMTQTV